MIHQALQDFNKAFFSPRHMNLDLLKNNPQAILTIAQWLYEEWHSYDSSLTLEKLIYSLNERLNIDRIPITFVVIKEGRPIGSISLKEQAGPEFSDFPRDSVWMGSLQVVPEERNQGVGCELLKFAAAVARCLGYERLYFYTSNAENVEWYVKRGAHVIGERSFRDHRISILQMPLKKTKLDFFRN